MDRPTTPKCKPKHLPNETLGLVRMLSCTACTTQQNSLIHSIPKIEFFHWLGQCHQYLGPYMISPRQSFTTPAPHTHMSHISPFVEESSTIQY